MKSDNKYNPSEIEQKWQKIWVEQKTYSPDIDNAKNPFYNLMMFPYPSAEGLHVGNMYAFTGADIYGRFKRMQGNDVFEPIGLDGFGIHSENYALKIGKHPKEQAQISQENFYRQLKSIGNGFDLTRTLETYDPEYYKWTQWLFITLFKSGLAYRKKAEVNWCPSCLTVLSDEQVIDGKCERCGTEVEKKDLEQWFFRITDYAQRLLDNIEGLDWTERVKIAQRNWIGRSEGAEVDFEIAQGPAAPHPHPSSSSSLRAGDGGPPVALPLAFKIKVFTTRPDTLYGATFMVLSPEHEIVAKLLNLKFKISNLKLEEIKTYVDSIKSKSDQDRLDVTREKTGVFSGLYAINPVNGKKIPVWIADYVLSSYGTGAIMAVPAHDQRDFEFAKKYDLEIVPVIKEKEASGVDVKMEKALSGQGVIIGSEGWNGFHVPEDISKVIDDLEARGLGKKKVNYHLRDWLISRQRYWGPPIPMLYCSNCAKEGKSWLDTSEAKSQHREIKNLKFKIKNSEEWDASGWYPVSEADLPVLLPDVKDWKPMGTGKAPLANHPEFYEVKCPECGGGATRETDVSDTFLDSAWYFLRYPNTNISTLPFDTERVRKWLPVDQYIGGAEHSVLHLLYSRFITMVLKDLEYLDFEEPFSKFYAHGLIIKDGAKMSKSKGNVVVPDEYIAKYGADSLRTYLMFIGPYSDGGDFRDSGIEGIFRFLKRVWVLFSKTISNDEFLISNQSPNTNHQTPNELDRVMHRTIKGATEDLENLRYNTAIAKLMEYYNSLNSFYAKYHILDTKYVQSFLLLLAPFAPHMAEELWQISREPLLRVTPNFSSIHLQKWPQFDTAMLVSDTVTIVVQVNGKRRGEFTIENGELTNEKEIIGQAKTVAEKYIGTSDIKKEIYVPGKIVNFVI